jgi:proteic killer suppression protein
MRIPPGNRWEALTGDLAGFDAVRINRQYRIIYRWTSDGPVDVRILDYQ